MNARRDGGMADTRALRALVRKGVWVRLPLAALESSTEFFSINTTSIIFSGCSSSVERSVWDREAGGPIPLTPT